MASNCFLIAPLSSSSVTRLSRLCSASQSESPLNHSSLSHLCLFFFPKFLSRSLTLSLSHPLSLIIRLSRLCLSVTLTQVPLFFFQIFSPDLSGTQSLSHSLCHPLSLTPALTLVSRLPSPVFLNQFLHGSLSATFALCQALSLGLSRSLSVILSLPLSIFVGLRSDFGIIGNDWLALGNDWLALGLRNLSPKAFLKSWTKMRPLDETETTAVFEKLFKFTGNNLKNIVENPSHEGPDLDSGRYCFRLHKNKVYYVSESLVKRATNIARTQLVSLGTCIGRFTHGGSFHLTVQCLSLVASNAKHKVWLKPTSEMSFLYGNHVLKGGLGRITENIVPGDGVVVFSMSDVPLGFGIAAKSTQDCRKLDPNGIVVLHQTDIGEYLRMEDDL